MHRHDHQPPTSTSQPARAAVRLAAVAMLATLATGCVMDEELDHEAPELLERDGVAYDRLGPIVEAHDEDRDEAVQEPDLEDEATIEMLHLGLEPTVLATLSRDELADKLRPVLATGEGEGELYIASEPAWDAADAVLGGSDQPFSVDPQLRAGRPAVEPAFEETFRFIFGSDNRSHVANANFVPLNSIARIRMFSGSTSLGACSGVYIGPWTMITAAHCLVDSDTVRANRIIFEPARAGSTLPYGSFDCRLDDSNTSNDYVWGVPSGFFTGQDPNFDFAVIDTFPCHGAPAHMAGYQANANAANYLHYGYPGATCPGAPSGGTFMCGMTGSAYPNGVWMESEFIDSGDGQSGGPWFRYISGGWKPVGTHTGDIWYFDFLRCGFDKCHRNAARRIDTAYSQFIVNTAWDF